MNAFVEVVFDNSDNRFALEASDEVVLRRTIGAKKDEFFVQRKRAKKQEVQSLLEGAGFSKSNPYFMVQQGKIQALCTMTDAQRLELLQQVAGTTVYEDKKAESLVKMQENKQSLEKIQTILDDLDGKLEELQEEKQELTQYQQADRQRKALEYTLYDKELRKARSVLDQIEHDRSNHVEDLTELQDAAAHCLEQVAHKEADIKTKYNSASRNRRTRQHLEEDKLKAVTEQAKIQLRCQELVEQVQTGRETLEQTQKELKTLEKDISKAQSKLQTKESELSKQTKALQKLEQAKDQAQRQMDAIYAKQGRGQQYATKEARDKVLKKQIRDLKAAQEEKNQLLVEHQSSLANVRRSVQETQKEIESKQQELTAKTRALQDMTKALDDKKKTQVELHEERKQAWRQVETLEETVSESRNALQKAAADMRKSMPRNTALGIQALEEIVQQEKLVRGEQYFGSLVENLTLKEPKYQTAVEVAAQNSLFHVIVDNDATAARLMKRLEDEKRGRVTFLPLNRLNATPTQAPQGQNEVHALLQTCVEFDPRVAKAMYHVFEKKLVAKNDRIASDWSAKSKMDCITLEGDIFSRKGALSGGYVDPNKSRIRAYLAHKEAKEAHQAAKQEFTKVDSSTKQLDQKFNNCKAEVSHVEKKKQQMSRAVEALQQKLKELTQSTLKQQEDQGKKLEELLIPPLEQDLTATAGDIERLEQEVGTELQQTLSDEERATLESLKKKLADLSDDIQSQQESVEELREGTQGLESLLDDNLLKRQAELTQGMMTKEGESTSASDFQEARQQELEKAQRELEEMNKAVEDLESKLVDARQAEQDLQGELVAAKSELDKLRNQDTKNRQALEEASGKSEKLMSKVRRKLELSLYSVVCESSSKIVTNQSANLFLPFHFQYFQKSVQINKRETYMRKIQELGSLPPPAELENYKNQSISELMKNLEKVNKKLKKYSHVNKKAFDQYVNFSEQRESLLGRKEELDNGGEKIQELIDNLDQKKDEAINRTFRGVSAHFKEVFKELVPLGAGELIMRTTMDEDNGEDEDTDNEMDSDDGSGKKKAFDPENPDVSIYKGVGIKVRFSEVGENFIMSQLSGGQKALVALALIFAIQRCDPAPFYIFDELDQALDSSYRQAVANLIQRQANSQDNPTQFIMSTFRPELVAVSKNCYGISHQNKVSSIHHMTKNDALNFIADLMNEEEAVGEVRTVGTSKGASRRESRKRKAIEAAGEDETEGRTTAEGISETVAA